MQRILKTLVVLALVGLTPFRAVAAVTVGYCASGHDDTSVAVHAQNGHGAGAHADRAADAPAQSSESSCNICAEHCSSAAFAIPAAPAVEAWVSGQDRTVLAEHGSALHVPDQLDRPPLA